MPASVGNPINIPRKAIPFVYGEVGANPSVTIDEQMRSKPEFKLSMNAISNGMAVSALRRRFGWQGKRSTRRRLDLSKKTKLSSSANGIDDFPFDRTKARCADHLLLVRRSNYLVAPFASHETTSSTIGW
jgi:hypothetical protein